MRSSPHPKRQLDPRTRCYRDRLYNQLWSCIQQHQSVLDVRDILFIASLIRTQIQNSINQELSNQLNK